MRVLGIDFAPISLPLHRRLETLMVTFHVTCFLSCIFIFPFVSIYLFFYSEKFWWIACPYMVWLYFDWDIANRGGRSEKYCFTRSPIIAKYVANYFPVKLIKTADLDPNKTYLACSHPHGLLCYGIFCSFATDALDVRKLFPGHFPRILSMNLFHCLPGLREILAATGCCGATWRGMETLLGQDKGMLAVLVPGGATESLNTYEKQINLILKRRKGFIKLALRFGRELVPVFSFGENFTFRQISNPEGSNLRKFQRWIQKYLLIPAPFFYGRGIFQYSMGIIPYRQPIHVVVGKPISVKKIENPTQDDIQALHDLYVEKLQELYEEYNPVYGDPDVKLVIT